VFAVDERRNEARLVSCWWTDQPNPPKPTPGQCDFVPFLDKARGEDINRPAILGQTLSRISSLVRDLERVAGDGYLPLDEMYVIPDEHEHDDNFLDAAQGSPYEHLGDGVDPRAHYDKPLSDPSSFYDKSYRDNLLYEPVSTHPSHTQQEGFDFGVSGKGTGLSVGDRDLTEDKQVRDRDAQWFEADDWDEVEDWHEAEEDVEVDARKGPRKYYGPKPVNPRNRERNRKRRREYQRNPTKRRNKQRQQKRYRRQPGTKRKRKLQKRRRKQRGRG